MATRRPNAGDDETTGATGGAARATADGGKAPSADAATTAWDEALAGLGGGLFSSTVTNPLDVVKTRLQLPGSPYHGTTDALLGIARNEGVGALYEGLSSEYLKTAAQSFFYFYWNARLKGLYRASQPANKSTPVLVDVALGCAAGALTQLVANPISVVQTRIVTRPKGQPAPSFLGALVELVRSDGPRGLFAGLSAALVLTLNPSIQFLVYERLKAWWVAKLRAQPAATNGGAPPRRDASPAELFVIGALAKVVATIVTFPFILAKTRLQWKGGSRYSGLLHVLLVTARDEGVLALYTGLSSQLGKSVLSSALMFMAKERISDIIRASHAKRL